MPAEIERFDVESALARLWVEHCEERHARRLGAVQVPEEREVVLVPEEERPEEQRGVGLEVERSEIGPEVAEKKAALPILVEHPKRVCCRAEHQHAENDTTDSSQDLRFKQLVDKYPLSCLSTTTFNLLHTSPLRSFSLNSLSSGDSFNSLLILPLSLPLQSFSFGLSTSSCLSLEVSIDNGLLVILTVLGFFQSSDMREPTLSFDLTLSSTQRLELCLSL